MWIWWRLEERDMFWALDPNMGRLEGVLVQDAHIAGVVGAYLDAIPVGLPFLNYVQYGAKPDVVRNGKTLYVSTHSTAWRDVSAHTRRAVKEFTKDNDVTVLLSWNDRHLADELGVPVEIGAGTIEATSFPRMRRIFETYDYMITDRMGSHVLYGMACGMKVGLSARYNVDTVFSEVALKNRFEGRAREIRTTEFLAEAFPGLVIESGLPSYTTMPEIPSTAPEEIARLLWDPPERARPPDLALLPP
jgi:hypothetical protein